MTRLFVVTLTLVAMTSTVATAAPVPVQPSDLSGLAMWLDASDASTFTFGTGTEVTQWRDKSGNLNHANAGGTKRPDRNASLGPNSVPAVSFNRDQLTTSNLGIGAGAERSILLVMEYSTLTTNNEVFGTSTANMIDVGTWMQSRRVRLRQSNNVFSGDNTFSPDAPHLLTAQALTSGNQTIAESDGVNIITNADPFAHYDLTGDVGVGGALFTDREYIGNLAEVLVYDRALSVSELDLLGGYVQDKYGFEITGATFIPEPSTLVLTTVILLSLGVVRCRRCR